MNNSRPLGLLDPSSVSADVIKRLEYADGFDLERSKIAAVRQGDINEHHADVFVRELKRFLSLSLLVQKPNYPFVPSLDLDKLWHVFITDTKKYHEFCDGAVGSYVHHVPEDARAIAIGKSAGEVYSYTLENITKFFGAATPSVWGSSGRCGSVGQCSLDCHIA